MARGKSRSAPRRQHTRVSQTDPQLAKAEKRMLKEFDAIDKAIASGKRYTPPSERKLYRVKQWFKGLWRWGKKPEQVVQHTHVRKHSKKGKKTQGRHFRRMRRMGKS